MRPENVKDERKKERFVLEIVLLKFDYSASVDQVRLINFYVYDLNDSTLTMSRHIDKSINDADERAK